MVANRMIDASRCQSRNAVGDRERHELDGNAEILAEQLADIGIEAVLLAAGIDEAPGRVVALDADDDLALGLDFGRCDRERGSRHSSGRGQQSGACEQDVAAIGLSRACCRHGGLLL